MNPLLLALIITATIFGGFIILLVYAGKKTDQKTKEEQETNPTPVRKTSHTYEEIIRLYNYCCGKLNNHQLQGRAREELYEATTKVGFMIDNPYQDLDCDRAYFMLINALPLDDQISIRYNLWY